MKNLHITHPEDLILDGKVACQNVIEIFRSAFDDYNQEDNRITTKYDGAPAIVFGTDPTNKRFFVGTKSVFNKRIKKICYTNDCIDYYYSEQTNLRNILRLCLKYLPRVAGTYQADFIGQGDGDTTAFTPNTITYKFDKAPTENIIMAIHTCYVGSNFDDMIAVPQYGITMPGLNVKWIDERVCHNEERIFEEAFKYSMDAIVDQLELMNDDDFPTFKTKKAKTDLLKRLNLHFKMGTLINAEDLANETAYNFKFFELYELILNAKDIMINRFIPFEKVECFINNRPTNHEGIVITHLSTNLDYNALQPTASTVTRIKLVDRYEFSRANFSNEKFAVAA